MYVEVRGIGFKKKVSLPAESTVADLKEKLADSNLTTFYRGGKKLKDSDTLNADDVVVATGSKQKIDLG